MTSWLRRRCWCRRWRGGGDGCDEADDDEGGDGGGRHFGADGDAVGDGGCGDVRAYLPHTCTLFRETTAPKKTFSWSKAWSSFYHVLCVNNCIV